MELKQREFSEEAPYRLEHTGRPTAQAVFEELKYRLRCMGYLSDCYFYLHPEWETGRKIPQDVYICCTIDYQKGSGVGLDVYLKWYDEYQKQNNIERFITGNTLVKNGDNLDGLFLTASTITKAFRDICPAHARYMKLDVMKNNTGDSVVFLSQQEQNIIIEALVEQRKRQEQAMSRTEQSLRHMTGNITEYINRMGMHPLRMSDFDKAVLAIRDGDMPAFQELYPKVRAKHVDELLIAAAGRPGAAGAKMMALMLENDVHFPEDIYCIACRNAVDLGDAARVQLLLAAADRCVPELSPAFHGELASYAHTENRCSIAAEIVKQCSEEQIAASPSYLLGLFAKDSERQAEASGETQQNGGMTFG